MARALAGLLAGLLVAGPFLAAHGQEPTVRVRAEARIEVRASGDGQRILVEGTLRDDVGQPLPEMRLQIRLTRDEHVALTAYATTDAAGAFLASIPGDAMLGRLEVTFDGDAHHAVAHAERAVDPARREVSLLLHLAGGSTVSLDRPAHRLEVRADSAAGGGGLALEVLDELERKLAVGLTDQRGGATFRLPSEHLGPPGSGRIRVRTRGDERRHEAQTELPIVRTRASSLSLSAPSSARAGDAIQATGVLRDRLGPLPERAVGIFDGETHLASALTNADGRYALALSIPDARRDAYALEARFESDNPGRLGARSSRHAMSIDAPGAGATRWVLICAAALFAIAAAMRWAPKTARRPAPAPQTPPRFELRPKGASATARTVRGEVLDARDDRPLPDAMVSLVDRGGHARAVSVGPDGRFEIDPLPDGSYRLLVEARGYGPAELRFDVPHRGELDLVRVRLESLRARASAALFDALRRLARTGREARAATDRELLVGLPPPPPDGLPSLVARVERVVYDAPSPSADEVEAIEQASQRFGGEG